MRLFFALQVAIFALSAQTTTLRNPTVRQGDVIRVTTTRQAATLRLNKRTTQLFQDKAGAMYGLVPIPVLEKPGVYKLEVLAKDGRLLETHPVTVTDARFRRQNVSLAPSVTSIQPSPGEMETVRKFRQTISGTRYWDEPFEVPLPGCMTSPFGVLRLHNGKPTGNFHGGIDQRGPTGDPIRAVAAGKIELVRMFNIHGGTVGIDHGHGLVSIYLHMSDFAVQEGANVKKGDVIGYVGSTGRSNAPHLHWSLYAHGVSVNPLQWVRVAPCAPAPKKPPRK